MLLSVLFQLPPVTASLKVVVAPIQTLVAPVIAEGVDEPLTAIAAVVAAVPQLFVTV